jgi:Response regulator containing CheY-like receiver, AAA-type ATPase, and DNA-binding domains
MMAKRFLLIDDDADDSEMFLEALSKVDPSSKCNCFPQGRLALARLTSYELEAPDVIFLDINLPVMSGWDILTELKRMDTCKDIPVIMYSTSSHHRDQELAKELGALCFFTKPNNYRLLIKMMEIVVENLNNNSISHICPAVRELLH